tara:strand:+ start:219 stop:320 length:102 start_codon:yes stop_codon:yes gene_type:complete
MADKHQYEEKKAVESKLEKDPKYFIKRNMNTIN